MVSRIHGHADDPDAAARAGCIVKWTSGTHEILVVSLEEAHRFRVTIETESVDD
jgi:hypothetical protein